MVGVGRDLCGSSSPAPLLKQGHLQQAAQDLVQAGLEYLQRRRLHNLPGQPGPVLQSLLSIIDQYPCLLLLIQDLGILVVKVTFKTRLQSEFKALKSWTMQTHQLC